MTSKKISNIWIKRFVILLGIICLVLGFIGIFLPLLPTTPFLLLAAYLFSKSSDKFYNKLLNSKVFGPYIKNFKEGKGISLKTKITSILTITITFVVTILFFIDVLYIKILLATIGISVSYYLSSLKTLKK